MRKHTKAITAAALLGLALFLSSMGTKAQEERGNFVFGDYVGSVDPASGAYAWVGMRTGVMESLFKFDNELNVGRKIWLKTIPCRKTA